LKIFSSFEPEESDNEEEWVMASGDEDERDIVVHGKTNTVLP